MMAAVKGKNTKPERIVRSAVFAQGFRYRLHVRELPGSPDLVFRRYRVAVFVNGCFWHGHACPRGKRPESNRDFWNRKINSNIERDRKATSALRKMKWTVHVVWACRIEAGTKNLIRSLRTRQRRLTHLSQRADR